MFGVFEGLVDAEDGGPSGFGAGGVFAGSLAELFGALCHVEDVVDDLEGETGFFAEDAEACGGVGIGGIGCAAWFGSDEVFFASVAAGRTMTQA